MKRRGTPKGWLRVPPIISDAVREAVNGIISTGVETPARVERMARTLLSEAKIGPTTVEALKRMLVDENDQTYSLLGGDVTREWVFAPQRFEDWIASVHAARKRLNGEEKKMEADPSVRKAWAALHSASEKALAAWERANPP